MTRLVRWLSGFAVASLLVAQPAPRAGKIPFWQPPASTKLISHFELVDGRKVLYVDGLPYTVLTVEISWFDLIYGRYAETMHVYDYVYPAAASMQLNALKVPIKWSMVEPEEGVYDFSYVDHVKRMAERSRLKLVLGWFGHYASAQGTAYSNLEGAVYAPMYVIKDEKRFPRAVDGNGKAHPDALSYDYDAIIERETAAFRAFMQHIRKVDADTRTVVMVQVENEIATFGNLRQDPKMWRDHSPESNRLFSEKGFTDDLKYTAWSFASRWIRRITDAGAAEYPLPFFHNFVNMKIADWMVGGAPGEHVPTYLENCPAISFIGLNHYVGSPGSHSADAFRAELNRYKIGRNLPSVTETNSDRSPLAPRSLFLSVGEYGSPLFAPWALTISVPTRQEPYVLRDGTVANGAFALREACSCLRKAMPAISYFGGTKRLKVFLADFPGMPFSQTADISGVQVAVSGSGNGQAIAVRPADNEILVAGYRCVATLHTDLARLSTLQRLHIEKGSWIGGEWRGRPADDLIEAGRGQLRILFSDAEVVRVYWHPDE